MESISKKDLARGLNSNRDRDRLDFSSIEKIKELYDNNNNKENKKSLTSNIENQRSLLPDFNSNETNIIQDINMKNECIKENIHNLFHEKDKIDYKKEKNDFNLNNVLTSNLNEQFKTENKEEKLLDTSIANLNEFNVFKNNETKIFSNENYVNSQNQIEEIENNFSKKNHFNTLNNGALNQKNSSNAKDNYKLYKEDQNKPEFLMNTPSNDIQLNEIDNKSSEVNQNFNQNELNIKDLINNEISKISHDNFNDLGNTISDNEEVEELEEINPKKYDYINAENEKKQAERKNNYISIRNYIYIYDKTNFFIIIDDENDDKNEQNKLTNRINQIDKNKSDKEVIKSEKKLENLNEMSEKNMSIINSSDRLKVKDRQDEIFSNEFRTNKKIEKNDLQNLTKSGNKILEESKNDKNKFSTNKNQQQTKLINLKQSTFIHQDAEFLNKIETTNNQKNLEIQREKEEIEKEEIDLTIMQRLINEKWQIRKNAFKQLADLISTIKSNIDANRQINTNNFELEQELIETMETLFPWFKYLITDNNVIALCEGLNSFCFLLQFCNNEQKNRALILFFDELEKLIMQSKQTISDICLKIILNTLRSKKLANFIISEIIRNLNSNNNKFSTFLSKCIEEMLDNSFNDVAFSNYYLKLLFEKAVFYFNNTKQLNKNIEKRKILGKTICVVFEKVYDDIENIKYNLNLNSDDLVSLEKLLLKSDNHKKENKDIKYKYRLYEPINIAKIQNNLINAINKREIDSEKIKDKEAIISYDNFDSVKKNHIHNNHFKASLKENKKALENDKIYSSNYEDIDLFNILPSEFFEIPYITTLKLKKEILENVNEKLLEIDTIGDKDYKDFLTVVNHSIDDTNILVNLEGIRLIKNFCKLTKNVTNQLKLKSLVICCYEKFKDKKTNVKLELFELFDIILINNIFPLNQFFIFKLRHILTQKNPCVKINLLEYVKNTINKYNKSNIKEEKCDEAETYQNLQNNVENSEEEKFEKILNKSLNSKTIIEITKVLASIIEKDSNSLVKDFSIEILLILKSILVKKYEFESLEEFEQLICELPYFRSNMIKTGKTSKNKFDNNQNFEKEYKMNLERIKSSGIVRISNKFSPHKINKLSKKSSLSKERKGKDKGKHNEEYQDETNTEKNHVYQRKKNSNDEKKYKIEYKNDFSNSNYENNNEDFVNEKIVNEKLKKIKTIDLNRNKLDKRKIDSHDDQNYINKYKKIRQKEKEKESKSNKIKAKFEMNSLDNSVNYSDSQTLLNENNEENVKQISGKNKNLQRNIEADIYSISDISPIPINTDKTNLEKKMETAIEYISNLNEENIFDYAKSVIRDFLIFIKKVTSTGNIKEDLDCHFKVILKILIEIYNQMELLTKRLNFLQAKEFIPEEIFIQTFKIIVVAPCFLIDVESCLIQFIKKVRKTMENDKRFFEIYYEILNKFVNFEKGNSFLKEVNAKNSFIVFYDYFLLDDPPFEEIQLLKKFESHISKNILLNEEEKKKYIKEFKQALKIIEITQRNSKIDETINDKTNKLNNLSNSKEEKLSNDKDEEFHEKKIETNKNAYIELKKINNDLFFDIDNEKLEDNKIIGKNNKNSYDIAFNEKGEEEDQDVCENEEELIMKNYGKIFNSKQNKIINSNEKANLETDVCASFDNKKTQTLKNSNINITPSISLDSKKICKTEISNNNDPIIVPYNLDKDILKIKDSIKEKSRKLDMNIKRINSKIVGDSQSNTKILFNHSLNNLNSTVNNDSFQQNQHQLNKPNQLNDILLSQNNTKQINSLEDTEDSLNRNNNVYRSQDIYNIYNLPRFNNANFQNKNNNLPFTNRSSNDYSNLFAMKISNPSYDVSHGNLNDFNKDNQNIFIQNQDLSQINTNKTILNLDEIKKLILKIPTIILDNCLSEISVYILLENSFIQLNYELKNDFANFLACSINNSALIKTSSFNCFLQLLEFLLGLLIFVFNKFIFLFIYRFYLIFSGNEKQL